MPVATQSAGGRASRGDSRRRRIALAGTRAIVFVCVAALAGAAWLAAPLLGFAKVGDYRIPDAVKIGRNVGGVSDFDVSGDYVVWTVGARGHRDLQLYDAKTKKTTTIDSNPADLYSPRVSGSLVVWVDERNGNPDIYAYDMASGKTAPVCTNPGVQKSPAVNDGLIAWTDMRNDAGDVYCRRRTQWPELVFTSESRLTTEGEQSSPDVFDGKIAWTVDGAPTHVTLLDYASGQVQELWGDGFFGVHYNVAGPCVGEDGVVLWTSGIASDWQIVRSFDGSAVDIDLRGLSGSYPQAGGHDISGHFLVYSTLRVFETSAGGEHACYLRDVWDPSVETTLVKGPESAVRIDGRRIVWWEDTDTGGDVYMLVKGPPPVGEAPTITDVSAPRLVAEKASVSVTATISDNRGVGTTVLLYRNLDSHGAFKTISPEPVSEARVQAASSSAVEGQSRVTAVWTIPAEDVVEPGLEFIIRATDADHNSAPQMMGALSVGNHGYITGTVTSMWGRRPLPGVLASASGRTARTGSDGRYALHGLDPAEAHDLVLSKRSYVAHKRQGLRVMVDVHGTALDASLYISPSIIRSPTGNRTIARKKGIAAYTLVADVRASDKTPLPGVKVELQSRNSARAKWKAVSSSYTNVWGRAAASVRSKNRAAIYYRWSTSRDPVVGRRAATTSAQKIMVK